MQRSFLAGNGDLPAFLSLTGHLLQKPRGEAMNAENAPLVCRASLTPGEDGVGQVLAGDQQAAWPGAIVPSENRAYSHYPAVLS
jgi:hypothetical protein